MKNSTPKNLAPPKSARIYNALAQRHGVSKSYVRQIALGLRETNTEKSLAIAKDLEETVKFLNRPVPPPPGAKMANNKTQVS
ncbi:MAG: hypothetical protein U1C58_06110 [Flavobacteriaceae bacterium]|nr:hypothetical protein [Flavobacteriaceae bacterium]MDZ4147838.1 hypothetical protein [Flavobacteriaceae bacterium]